MYKQQTIKKIVAAFMLIVFAFSITPSIVFHNWLATHTDTYKKATNQKSQQVGKQTFNCHCDHIVAESPFTEPTIFTGPQALQVVTIIRTAATDQLPYTSTIFYSLRGPPVV